MASLLGSTVAANYRKSAASSKFGTRELTFVKITATESDGSTAVDFSAETAGSDFFLALNALQGFAEVYFADGGTAGIVVAVATDTANQGDSNTTVTGWGMAEAAILSALGNGGSSTATVTALAVASNGLSIA